ncbi:beta-lactamase family protein [bacterium AH-315-P07]|nr:beta-lactamase family protein [bacterium AH-315-P07]
MRWSASTLSALALWATLIVIGTLNGWVRDSIAPVGDTRAFMDATVDQIETESRGNIAFVLIEDGLVYDEHFASIGDPVDRDTVFQVASLSKWITAWGVMALVDDGKLDLDVPVSTYLTRWQLPQSEFDNDGVTIRRLLSHTAGLTDGLGYAGFPPGTPIQTLEESLADPNSSSEDEDNTIQVGLEPGAQFEYSGGGYTILQLLIEEVSGGTFESYIQHAVFDPLEMTHSSYVIDERNVSNQAVSYQLDGTPTARHLWTNTAAASVYTSASDMVRFVQAHIEGPKGEPAGRGVLTPETVHQKREPHASVMGMDIWGLGDILLAPNEHGGFVIGGAGIRARPAINADVRINPATGNGVVILQTGNRALATDLASEWTFWETKKLDLMQVRAAAESIVNNIAAGWIVILFISLLFAWQARKRFKAQS